MLGFHIELPLSFLIVLLIYLVNSYWILFLSITEPSDKYTRSLCPYGMCSMLEEAER